MFPPINLISKVVKKFINNTVYEGLLVTPFWPGLSVAPMIFDLLTRDPVYISAECLEGVIPTRHQLPLVGCSISTVHVKKQAFQQDRQARCLRALEQIPSEPMSGTGINIQIGWAKAGIHLLFLYQ